MRLSSVPAVGCWSAESEEDEIACNDVKRAKNVLDGWMVENGVPEDIEHVMPVIRKREGVDYRIEVNNHQSNNCGRCKPENCAQMWQMAIFRALENFQDVG